MLCVGGARVGDTPVASSRMVQLHLRCCCRAVCQGMDTVVLLAVGCGFVLVLLLQCGQQAGCFSMGCAGLLQRRMRCLQGLCGLAVSEALQFGLGGLACGHCRVLSGVQNR